MSTIISQLLDTVGDESGTTNFNGDYSATVTQAKIAPQPGEVYEIHRMIVCAEDASGMQAEEYGNLGAALGVGIKVQVQYEKGGNTVTNLLTKNPIKTNAAWGSYCYDVDVKSWGAGNELLLVRWTFARSGVPIVLSGKSKAELQVVLNDNFSGLVAHNFLVQGNHRS